jgi:hypothetical protein
MIDYNKYSRVGNNVIGLFRVKFDKDEIMTFNKDHICFNGIEKSYILHIRKMSPVQ